MIGGDPDKPDCERTVEENNTTARGTCEEELQSSTEKGSSRSHSIPVNNGARNGENQDDRDGGVNNCCQKGCCSTVNPSGDRHPSTEVNIVGSGRPGIRKNASATTVGSDRMSCPHQGQASGSMCRSQAHSASSNSLYGKKHPNVHDLNDIGENAGNNPTPSISSCSRSRTLSSCVSRTHSQSVTLLERHPSSLQETSPGTQDSTILLNLRSSRGVSWNSETVDNEFLNRHSSKCCCVYHKPREFGESSSDEEDGKK